MNERQLTAEDQADLAAARETLAESGERIPYEEVSRQLGLTDEAEA